ncbi:TPA: hypothetical protein ACWLUJ_005748 [Pseudomonas aeruginosa]|nr:hypothetical protein [Pseudomonas aeruginosa]
MTKVTVHGPQGGCGKTSLALALASLGYGYASWDPLNEVLGSAKQGVLITDTSPHWTAENARLVAEADVLVLPIKWSPSFMAFDLERRISEVLEARSGKTTLVVCTSDSKAAAGLMEALSPFLRRPGVSVFPEVITIREGECDPKMTASLASKLF